MERLMDFSPLVVEDGTAMDGRTVLRLRGEVDMERAGALRERLVREATAADLALDLSELSFIDSSGLLALHEAHAAAGAAGHRMVLVSPSATVGRIVALIGMDHLEFSEDRTLLGEEPAGDA